LTKSQCRSLEPSISDPKVTLVPLTEEQREAFFVEELADYADEQVRDAGWPRDEALERARDELTPVLERDFAEGLERGDRLWTAVDRNGRWVGWLWIKALEHAVVFLEQITVAQSERRRGYGRAMLAALEERLIRDAIEELRLNVNRANEPARALYAGAGYEEVGRSGRRLFLRKRLDRAV
jgi:ribosomal protein S18 acetylase RimI-like enzyme